MLDDDDDDDDDAFAMPLLVRFSSTSPLPLYMQHGTGDGQQLLDARLPP